MTAQKAVSLTSASPRSLLRCQVEDRVLLATPEYEARASISSDGIGGLWIAAERGREQWGQDSRGHENDLGFNAHKRLLLGRYDIAKTTFTEVPVPDKGRPTPAPDPSPGFAVNVPSVCVREGVVWLSYRYFAGALWRGAMLTGSSPSPANGQSLLLCPTARWDRIAIKKCSSGLAVDCGPPGHQTCAPRSKAASRVCMSAS
jgi:hypothetical protein